MTRLVVFDLDGTLIDSRQDLADATNALLVELGAAPLATDAVSAMVGEGVVVLMRRALTAAGLDPTHPGAVGRFLALYDERLLRFNSLGCYAHTREQPMDGSVKPTGPYLVPLGGYLRSLQMRQRAAEAPVA